MICIYTIKYVQSLSISVQICSGKFLQSLTSFVLKVLYHEFKKPKFTKPIYIILIKHKIIRNLNKANPCVKFLLNMMATWFSWLVVSAEYVFEETLYRRSLASFLLWQWNYKTRNSFIIHLYKRMLIKGNLELHIFVNVIIFFFFYIMSCATWLKLLVEISMSLKHSFNGNVYLVEKKERKFYKHVYANKLRASITTVITFW